MRLKYLIPLLVIISIAAVYLWPVKTVPIEEIYSRVPAEKLSDLQSFRATQPPKTLEVDGVKWEYLASGTGSDTIVFLHGMTGSYDIWWQQIETFQTMYRVVAVTYPALNSLAELENGLIAILEHEGIDRFNIVGTSLGGYFAQYLTSKYPDRIEKSVFANTFPPNDLILQKNGTIGALIPYLPEWLVMNVLRGSFEKSIFPSSGNDELTLSFLNEISYGRMRKAQVAGRYQCVVEKFELVEHPQIPILIIEASNDPLVELALREQLQAAYPSARVATVNNGHFPYISDPAHYNQLLLDFFQGK